MIRQVLSEIQSHQAYFRPKICHSYVLLFHFFVRNGSFIKISEQHNENPLKKSFLNISTQLIRTKTQIYFFVCGPKGLRGT